MTREKIHSEQIEWLRMVEIERLGFPPLSLGLLDVFFNSFFLTTTFDGPVSL